MISIPPRNSGSRKLSPQALAQALETYPIIDLGYARGGSACRQKKLAIDALSGGATIIQLRQKAERYSELRELALALRPALRKARVPLIINDHLGIALDVGADGIHLGQEDDSVSAVLRLAQRSGRPDLIIGLSVRTIEEAAIGLRMGANYLSASPLFGTATKPNMMKPVGLEGLRAMRRTFGQIPICAIGGIKPRNAIDVFRAGADGVCFVSALDGQAAVREIRAAKKQLHKS